MKVMIVDDERPIVEGLKTIIRRELEGEFEVVASASSGREALGLLGNYNPDIILIDVMMPGLSGLDTIREVRRMGRPMVFILITAYERFEIAREAVSLQVLEYLVKPLERRQVVHALRDAAAQMAGLRSSRDSQLVLQEQQDQTRKFQAKALCYGIMTGEDLSNSREGLLSSLGLEPGWMSAGALVFRGPGAVKDYEALSATINYKTRALLGPLTGERAAVILGHGNPSEALEAQGKILGLLSESHQDLFSSGFVRLGWGPAVPWSQAHLGWCEALMRAQFPEAQAAVLTADDGESFFQFEERLLDQGTTQRAEILIDLLNRDATLWAELGSIQPWGRYRWVILLGNLYRRLALEGGLSQGEALGLMDFRDITGEIPPEVWRNRMETRLQPLLEKFRLRESYSPPVSKALEIIRKDFSASIGLETVSDQIGISPGRLSRLFVLETGKGFSDHLIELRLELARKLLSRPGASVKQVSLTCGYPDSNYFARLFKKKTGLTPSSFQISAQAEADEE